MPSNWLVPLMTKWDGVEAGVWGETFQDRLDSKDLFVKKAIGKIFLFWVEGG